LYKIPANTLFTGQTLVYMPECHSTNAEALKVLQSNPQVAEGAVLITDNQTAGRTAWQYMGKRSREKPDVFNHFETNISTSPTSVSPKHGRITWVV